MRNALLIVLYILIASAAFAADPEDKDMTILQLRRALAEEKIERLRLDYIVTKAQIDKIEADIAAKQKAKTEGKTDEK